VGDEGSDRLNRSYYRVALRKAPKRISNREVIDELRLIQQQMRELDVRMSRVETKQEKLALSFIRCAMSVSDSQLVLERGGVHRAG